MDQGVIRSTKAFYRGMTVHKYIDAVENSKPPPNVAILDAMTDLVGAWNRVCLPRQFRIASKKQALTMKHIRVPSMTNNDNPFRMLTEEMESLRANNRDFVPESVTPDDVIDTDEDVLT